MPMQIGPPGALAESRSGKAWARPVNFQPDVSEVAGQAHENEQQPIVDSEAGKRNAHVKL